MHLCIIYFCLIRGGSVGSLGGLHWGSICSVTELKTVYLLWVTGCHGCDTCGDQGENCVYSCLPSTPSTPPVPIQVSCVATRERTESTAVYLVHLALPGTCLTTCPYTGKLCGAQGENCVYSYLPYSPAFSFMPIKVRFRRNLVLGFC